MKECEVYSSLKVPCSSKVVIRVDGRNFRQLSKYLKLKKPYDEDFAQIMVLTCTDLFLEFSPDFIYTFSDEINILLNEIPFGGRIEKLNSVFASFTSSSFTKHLSGKISIDEFGPLSFDSRVLPLSSEIISTYFQGRQTESWRNCINGYAYWTLREIYSKEKTNRILSKKKSSDLHDIMYEHGVNLSKVPSWQRRGIGVYRLKKGIEGYNPLKEKKVVSTRKIIYPDWDLPLFSKNKFFDALLE
jgi:tRNA(His) 5'-end guanylyltransferase